MSNGAATTASLQEVHRKLTEQMVKTLDRDLADDMPTDAATMSVIKGFLKDNNITCDPADRDTTSELQRIFKAQTEAAEAARRKFREQGLRAVREDDQQTGT